MHVPNNKGFTIFLIHIQCIQEYIDNIQCMIKQNKQKNYNNVGFERHGIVFMNCIYLNIKFNAK